MSARLDYLKKECFLGNPSSQDLGDKLALIGMICHLTNTFKAKKPGITHYQVVKICCKDICVDDEHLQLIADLCDYFVEGCTKFPDFGVKTKDMPAKISNLIYNLLPF